MMKMNRLIMPNHIVIKDGLACGDKVTLLYDFNGNCMDFQLISDGCSYCTRMCEVLQQKYYHMGADRLKQECRNLEVQIKNNMTVLPDLIGLSYNVRRIECCLAPIRILIECADDLSESNLSEKQKKVNLYVDKMDCDACATRENVSWLYKKPSHIHGQYHISDEKRELLMRLGKLSLKNIDMAEIQDLYDSLGDDEFEFIEEYKLFPMVYHNLKKLDIIKSDDQRWRLLVYQKQRTVVAQREIKMLSEYIIWEKKKAYWVKGAFTRDLYQEKEMRNLTDFDLLAINEDDAFDVIEWMIKHDYKIFPDSFSLKKTRQNQKDIYTGHLHFQKIINMQYRLIVDINFTGFPMIRVASYVPNIKDSRISLESMIVVTLCHLFKHKEVFMKDINDLYLMLTHSKLQAELLEIELKKNNLEDLFGVVFGFIEKEYYIPDDAAGFKALQNYYGNKISRENHNWPYSPYAVNEIKKREFSKFAENMIDEERLYLYPTLIFTDKRDVAAIISDIQKKDMSFFRYVEKLTDNLFEVKIDDFYLVLSPIGYFLEMKEHYEESMKENIRYRLNQMIEMEQIDFLEIPYAIAFEENWLDTEEE